MSRKNNATLTPAIELNGRHTPPAVPTKKDLIANLDGALAGLQTARQSVSDAIKAMANSGLWKTDALIEAVKATYKARGMSPQAASLALVRAGIRQRAERKDKHAKRSKKDNAENPTANNPTPATPPIAGPAVQPAELPTDPAVLAKALVAKLGKENAIKVLANAYAMASLG